MLENLNLYNFPNGVDTSQTRGTGAFVMQTCQRTLVLSMEAIDDLNLDTGLHLQEKQAYRFMLEMTCGLKSKLIGENEIVHQIKTAYQSYICQNSIQKPLLSILEKIFKDTKEIRTKYLIGLGQKTYASIIRKRFMSRDNLQNVLILGSGQMAEDLINQLKKKTKVFISARNTQRVNELTQSHTIDSLNWGYQEEYTQFAYVINTIGTKDILFDTQFFEAWAKNHDQKLFADLGSPSCLRFSSDVKNYIFNLEDVFAEGAVKNQEKNQKLQKALYAMDDVVNKRALCFQKKNLMAQNYKKQQSYETNI